MTRARIKGLAERTLNRVVSGPAGRVLVRHRVLILAYHNVLPGGTFTFGERSLQLSLEVFNWQLDELSRSCEVVPLTAILEPFEGSRRPRVAITFDDAYRGTVAHAIPALAERGMPATVFVPPGLLGGGAFWWDQLASTDGTIDRALRSELLEGKQGKAEAIEEMTFMRHKGEPRIPSDVLPASQDELALALSAGNIALGAHSWSHPNLAALDNTQVEEQLTRPLRWLEEHFPGNSVPWLSYPYGLRNPSVETATRLAGYDGAVLIEGGWFRPDRVSRQTIPRLNIPSGISREGFAIRLAGLLSR